jgi:hypothetical protein
MVYLNFNFGKALYFEWHGISPINNVNRICTGGAHNERTPINIYPLSGRLPTFVKQGVGVKMGKCGLDSSFWLNHFPGQK